MSKVHYVGKVGADLAARLVLDNPQVANCGLGVVQIDVGVGAPLPTLAGGYIFTAPAVVGDVYTPPTLEVGAVAYPLSIEDDNAGTYLVWSVVRQAWHLGVGYGYTSARAEARPLPLGAALRLIVAARDDARDDDDPHLVTVPSTIIQ